MGVIIKVGTIVTADQAFEGDIHFEN